MLKKYQGRDLEKKLCHLTSPEGEEMAKAITQFSDIFPDVPGRANCVLHNVDVGDAAPIKPEEAGVMRKEVDYTLKHGIIELSQSN